MRNKAEFGTFPAEIIKLYNLLEEKKILCGASCRIISDTTAPWAKTDFNERPDLKTQFDHRILALKNWIQAVSLCKRLELDITIWFDHSFDFTQTADLDQQVKVLFCEEIIKYFMELSQFNTEMDEDGQLDRLHRYLHADFDSIHQLIRGIDKALNIFCTVGFTLKTLLFFWREWLIIGASTFILSAINRDELFNMWRSWNDQGNYLTSNQKKYFIALDAYVLKNSPPLF